MARDRLVISNLTEIGLVDEVDKINLKENALTDMRNLKFRKGNLACASKLGSSVSGTPAFSDQTYRNVKVWKPYGTAGERILLAGSNFFEYCTTDGFRSAVPYWLGPFGISDASGNITGIDLGSTYPLGDAFVYNPGQYLTPNDKVFISQIDSPYIDEHTTYTNGALPAQWTSTNGTIAISSNTIVGGASGGCATHGTLSTASPTNIFASLRYCTLTESNYNGISMTLRDSVTKRGYTVEVAYCLTDTGYGGPDEYMFRLFSGYVTDVASTRLTNSLLVFNSDDADDDWTDYKDMWMWYRKPFLTIGYGAKVMYNCIWEIPFTQLEFSIGVGIGSSIGPKQGTSYNPIMVDLLTDNGPYTISALNYTSNQVTVSGLSSVKYGLVWGSKYCTGTNQVIRPTNEYVARLSSDIPMLIWKGGMQPEYAPTAGEPTADGYGSYVSWGGRDVNNYNGRLFLGGCKIWCNNYLPAGGYYSQVLAYDWPQRIMWSVPYDPDDWSDDDLSGFIELVDTPGNVQCVMPLRDTLMVYKDDAIIQFTPTGIADDPFTVRYFTATEGVDGPQYVVDAGKQHFFAKNENIYVVSVADVSLIPTSSSFSGYYKAYSRNSDSTVLFGGYNATSDAFVARGYNYKYGTTYELYLPDITAVDDAQNYFTAIKDDGTIYGYSAQTIDTATAFDPYSTAEYFQTPQITFGKPEYNKTVYCVDVYTRCTYTGGYTPSIILAYTVNGTTTTLSAVTSESLGGDLYRARFTFVANGTNFIFKVTSNDAANRIGYVSFIRLEVDYVMHEPDQRTTST